MELMESLVKHLTLCGVGTIILKMRKTIQERIEKSLWECVYEEGGIRIRNHILGAY